MNEWLKQPAGTPIEKTKDLFDSDTLFDTILLGTGPGPLYCEELLWRIGKKVFVLSNASHASGCLLESTKKRKGKIVMFHSMLAI